MSLTPKGVTANIGVISTDDSFYPEVAVALCAEFLVFNGKVLNINIDAFKQSKIEHAPLS